MREQAPVQFQRMPKPPGWQEEQAVEIRRDWITYLAKGMGIDTKVHTGHELETLVVRRMLEQAVRATRSGVMRGLIMACFSGHDPGNADFLRCPRNELLLLREQNQSGWDGNAPRCGVRSEARSWFGESAALRGKPHA